MKKLPVRVIIYLSVFLVFVVFIQTKKAEVTKNRAKEVESILSLTQKNGAPVTTYKVGLMDLTVMKKVTLKKCENSVCFYTSRDNKNILNVGSQVFKINSDEKIGEIQSISNSPDYRNGLYKVVVNTNNKKFQYQVSEVEVKKHKNILAVPVQSIIENNYVWVVENNKSAQKVKVQVGDKNYQFAEIKSGLKAGQTIILDGANQIPIYKKINILDVSKEKKIAPTSNNSEAKS